MSQNIWLKFRQGWLGERFRSLFPNWLVNFFWHLPRAIFSNFYYQFPSRKLFVIGVTGTDGKTTTATLIYEILLQAGEKTALISTVSAKIGQKEIPTGLHVTSPDSFVLQGLLKKAVVQRMDYVILESTSHGLAQHRLWGVRFQIGVITNVTQEHLDYHQTQERYLAAKGKLFKNVGVAVLNRDDDSFSYLNSIRASRSKLVTYALVKKADFTPEKFKFKTTLPGQHNQYNCLAAIAVASVLGVTRKTIKKAVFDFKGIKGRMDKIDLGQDFKVFIDFAHTPNALKRVLMTLGKKNDKKRLIAVFGCAGLRDTYKRPQMGKIAAQLADLVVLTAEDPRTENVNQIIDQIAQGCLKKGATEMDFHKFDVSKHRAKRGVFFRVPDRAEAIKFAIQKLARREDIVVVCGKGHEQSMCYGRVERPWSEHREVKKALKRRLKK